MFVQLPIVNGEIYATSRSCPHAGVALNYRLLKGNQVVPPLRGAMFDVNTGEIVLDSASYGLHCFSIMIEGADNLVEIINLS